VRSRWVRSLGLLCPALLASAALARTPKLPSELRGRVAIDVTRCRPIGRQDALLEADVVLRANEAAIALPGLHCGAYDDAGSAFFLTPVTGRLNLRARETQRLTVRFSADAAHRECGCTVRDVRALPAGGAESARSEVDAEFDALVARLSAEASQASGAPPPAAQPDDSATPRAAEQAASAEPRGVGPEPEAGEPAAGEAAVPFVPPALRYERVLAPNLSLRAEPAEKAAITGAAPAGARIAVDRIERGWKLARTPDGLAGWLPSDASSADIAAPERMAERLEPLHRAFAPGARRSEALCASVERDTLSELVVTWRVHERAVYVRPLWYALTPEDRDAFQAWAAECYAATRVMDAASGHEIHSEDWDAPR
jgi:hypothetical protein